MSVYKINLSDRRCRFCTPLDDEDYEEFFDSFGSPPAVKFDRYMNKHCNRWIYNRNHLHSVASSLYSLLFMLLYT